ncbi:hypothetical protein MMC13_008278 [Lambiella insularis]|nr:hypothetical protein [Lambiella insularis]
MDDDNLSDGSSELSSTRSMSPPQDYPSPVSSQEQEINNPVYARIPKKRTLDDSEIPGAKKRKTVEPKVRTTEYLDLSGHSTTEQKSQLDILMKVLRKRRKIVVIAGAGISVSAGSRLDLSRFRLPTDVFAVPDFRSSTGLFTTLRSEHKLKASGKHLFDASVYQTDSSTSSFHDMVRSLSHLVSAAEPTAFHHMLSTLGSEGRLLRLYTQNVDGIDVALPSLQTNVPLSTKGPWPRSIQLHGGLEKMVCSKCNHLSNFEPLLFDGPEPPLCKVCMETDKVRTDHAGKRSHGIGKLRPRIVLYNEHNPDEEAIGAVVGSDLRSRPDAVVVVGTSMKIPGVRRIVREMCGVVRGRRDGLAVWVNRDPPPLGKEFEDCWDLVVKGASDKVAQQWSDANRGYMDCTDSEIERAKQKAGKVQVVINSPVKNVALHGMPTPSASPHPMREKIMLSIKIPKKIPEGNFRLQPPQKSNKLSAALKTSKSTKAAQKSSIKSASRKKLTKKVAPKVSTQKINQKFKIAKICGPKMVAKTSNKSSSEAATHTPMETISPTSARNNGPPTSTSPKCPSYSEGCNSQGSSRSPSGSPSLAIPKDWARHNILNV